MSIINEESLEKQIIEYLKDKDYCYLDSKSIQEKRNNNLKEVILFDVLEEAIKKIHPGINKDTVTQMIFAIKNVKKNKNLIAANKEAHNLFINGIKVYNKTTKRYKNLHFVDFENIKNNSFIVANQFLMSSNHPEYEMQKPDLVVYLNGLPIVVFELKSPNSADDNIILKAYQQMQNYQEYLKDLFVFNIFNVLSDQNTNKYGTITSFFERYSFWRDLDKTRSSSSDRVKVFIDLLFDFQTLLKLLKNYVFFIEEEKTQKIIAGYHQFYGVEATKNAVVRGIDAPLKSSSKKGGIFWHTQGSGKTFSMVMLVKNVLNVKGKLTTLVVTDRNNLDEQTYQVFQKATRYIGQKMIKIASIVDLENQLKNKQQSGIFFSTIQKFAEQIPELSTRDDILIVADEAHRSHNNPLEGQLKIVNENQIVSKNTYTKRLHVAFPNAVFVGFTATPITKEEYSTTDVFGNYVSKYLLDDALKDGFVVDIKYESSQETLRLSPDKIAQLDQSYREVEQKISSKSVDPSSVIKNFNKRIQNIEKIIGDNDRLEKVAKNFIKHYKTRKNVLKGKALFVAFNRKIAIKYYHAILKSAPELKKNLKIIITKNQQTDKPEEIALIPDKEKRIKLAREFKKPDSSFKIAIVVEMWLTGFDVPCLDVIYIDRYLKMHNLMQAICRVNRVYSDENNLEITKKTGLVVDYIGIWKKLKEAFQFYSSDIHANSLISKNIQINKENLMQIVDEIYQTFFSTSKPIDFIHTDDKKSNHGYKLLQKMQNIIIKNKQQQQFVKKTHSLSKEFNITLSILSNKEKNLVQFLILTRSLLIKREITNFDLEYEIKKINVLIEEAILHNKTIIHQEITIKKKISLSEFFQYLNVEKIQPDDYPYLTNEKKIHAFKTVLRDYSKTNPIRSQKLSAKLKKLLQKYDNNFMTLKELQESLKVYYQQVKKDVERDQNSDMTKEEISFFEIISDNKYSKSSYDRKMIRKITKEVYNKVKKIVDRTWYYNEAKKQKVRAEIKKVLMIYKYPKHDTVLLQKSLVINLTNCMETEPSLFSKK